MEKCFKIVFRALPFSERSRGPIEHDAIGLRGFYEQIEPDAVGLEALAFDCGRFDVDHKRETRIESARVTLIRREAGIYGYALLPSGHAITRDVMRRREAWSGISVSVDKTSVRYRTDWATQTTRIFHIGDVTAVSLLIDTIPTWTTTWATSDLNEAHERIHREHADFVRRRLGLGANIDVDWLVKDDQLPEQSAHVEQLLEQHDPDRAFKRRYGLVRG